MKKTVTQKKVKVCGVQEFINSATGEIVEMQVQEIEERDFNFTKIWMRNFVSTLELVGNKRMAVAFWIIDHLDKENRIISTVRKMSDEIGVSIFTVSSTMKILQEADFLRMLQSGVYMVNPDIIFKGQHNARISILNEYYSADYKKPQYTKEEKIKMLRESIEELNKQIQELEAEETENNIIPMEKQA